MDINDKFVQLHGPFDINDDIVEIIRTIYFNDFYSIKKIGIQSIPNHSFYIQKNPFQNFQIGKTGILEFNDVAITSLIFKQAEPETTLIDCILR